MLITTMVLWFSSFSMVNARGQETLQVSQSVSSDAESNAAAGIPKPQFQSLPLTASRVSLVIAYCGAIMLASVIGGYLPSIIKLTHTGTQTIISVVGGLMLGIAMFHLLPHATQSLTIHEVVWWMMSGIVATFLIIRWFHFHHHGPLEISTEKEEPCSDMTTIMITTTTLIDRRIRFVNRIAIMLISSVG